MDSRHSGPPGAGLAPGFSSSDLWGARTDPQLITFITKPEDALLDLKNFSNGNTLIGRDLGKFSVKGDPLFCKVRKKTSHLPFQPQNDTLFLF